jgi:glycine betaine catabolism A
MIKYSSIQSTLRNAEVVDMRSESGGPLAGPDYADPQVFAREERELLPLLPILAAPASILSELGSFVSLERGRDAIFVVKGPGGRVCGFANHCLHRGFRLVEDRCGKTQRFVCPYHGWSYASDGRLLSARGLASGEKAVRGLLTVPVVEMAGFYLLASPSIGGPILEQLADRLGTFHLADAVVAAHQSFVARCNWKLWVENFLECWHCQLNHPQLSSTEAHIRQLEAEDYESYLAEQNAWRRRADRAGYSPGIGVELCSDDPVFGFCETVALGGQRRSPTPTGNRLGPALADEGLDGGIVFGALGPFLHFSIAVDHAVIFSFIPTACDQTRVDCYWLTRSAKVDQDSLTWLWRHTLEQDRRLTERLHRSVGSGLYTGGCYVSHEQRSARFARWWLRWRNSFPANADKGWCAVPGRKHSGT